MHDLVVCRSVGTTDAATTTTTTTAAAAVVVATAVATVMIMAVRMSTVRIVFAATSVPLLLLFRVLLLVYMCHFCRNKYTQIRTYAHTHTHKHTHTHTRTHARTHARTHINKNKNKKLFVSNDQTLSYLATAKRDNILQLF